MATEESFVTLVDHSAEGLAYECSGNCYTDKWKQQRLFQRLASQEVSAYPAPLQADSVPFMFAQNDTSEQATSQPAKNHRDQTLPYLTPYQLIFDSDSDLDDAVRSPN
ncbi:unnamed protein product [Alternaria alternata]